MHGTDKKVILIYLVILLGSVLCLAMIFLAPLLKSVFPFMSDLLYIVYSPLCHQNPTRCFVLFGGPLAVCARCLGVYGGFLLGTLGYPLFRDWQSLVLPRKTVLITMSLPLVIDAAGNLCLLWMTNEWIRLLTGVLWGSILPFFLIPGVIDMVRNKMLSAQFPVPPLNHPVKVPE